ncbi:MAG TPA: phosphotransferase [Polyangiaceae bacterium]
MHALHPPERFVLVERQRQRQRQQQQQPPELAARSATAVVFAVKAAAGGAACVCKRLTARTESEAWMRARLVAEGQLLARLQGRGAPRLVASGEDAYGPWLVLERVDGEPLAARMGFAERAADPAWAALAARAAFGALAQVHAEGVVHGDLSPDNVMLSADAREATLLDFGLSVWPGAPPMPEGPFRGTLLYAAPEVARGDSPDARSDAFALAASLLHVASGEPPRTAPTQAAMLLSAGEQSVEPWARRAAATLPAALAAGLVACCAFERDARPPGID